MTNATLQSKTTADLIDLAKDTGLAFDKWAGATENKYRKFLIGNILIAQTKPDQVQMVLGR